MPKGQKENTLTVKELSEFTGKNERTIQRWIGKTADKVASVADKMASAGHGKVVDYNVDEVEAILSSSTLSKDAVSILMQNARAHVLTVTQESTNAGTLSQKDCEKIACIVSQSVAETLCRLRLIGAQPEENRACLTAPKLKPRENINLLVRDFATKKQIAYSQAWGELYKQFSYRTNSNPSTSAKNRSMSILDYIECEGQIETLEAVAVEMCEKVTM